MIDMKLNGAVLMAQQLLQPRMANARMVVDCTAGNGKDTLFLARHASRQTSLWVFDIQEQAISATKKLLTEHNVICDVHYILDCHSNISSYIAFPVDIITFNLGYLPGGDHDVTTQADTTIKSVQACIELLASGGLITIVSYPGHQAGNEENNKVNDFLCSLPQQKYTVACWQMINQIHNPPILYAIERKEKKA